jgi:hypothetical protein
MIEPDTSKIKGVLDEAIKKIDQEVREGVRHGFFQCEISCELIHSRKRRLTIKAGKSHQFVIEEEELSD